MSIMHKFLFGLLISGLAALALCATTKPVTYDSNTGVVNTPANFSTANNLPTFSNVQIYSGPMDEFTDMEIKVLAPNGTELYFFTTVNFNSSWVKNNNPAICDTNAVCYYFRSGPGVTCAHVKTQFSNLDSSIASQVSSNLRIGGIIVQPSAAFLPVFNNPNNTVVIWRIGRSGADVDTHGGKIWRPAVVQFFKPLN